MSKKKKKSRHASSTSSTNGSAHLIAEQEAVSVASALTHEIYLPVREGLNQLEQKSTEKLDDSILKLAVAALGVTIMFSDNIAPDPHLWTLPLLFLGWIALVGSIIAVVVSHRFSQLAIRHQRDLLDNEMETLEVQDQTNPSAERTDQWNSWALALFVAGLTLLLIYSGANLFLHRVRKVFPDEVKRFDVGDEEMAEQGKDNQGDNLRAVPRDTHRLRAVPSKKDELQAVPRGDIGDDVSKVQGGAVPPKTPVIRERPPTKKEK